MTRRERIARIIDPRSFGSAEHWHAYAVRLKVFGWDQLEFTGRYLRDVQDAFAKADEIIALSTGEVLPGQARQCGNRCCQQGWE